MNIARGSFLSEDRAYRAFKGLAAYYFGEIQSGQMNSIVLIRSYNLISFFCMQKLDFSVLLQRDNYIFK